MSKSNLKSGPEVGEVWSEGRIDNAVTRMKAMDWYV